MQFQVPQYIDVEDHIVGPLTLRQFLYIATGFLIIFTSFFFFVTWLWLPFSLVTAAISLAFALIKYNGRPLLAVTLAAFHYLARPKMYVWQKPLSGEERPSPPPTTGLLARLGLELLAGTKPIAGRERVTNAFFGRSLPASSGSEVLREITGNREVAKRVDYR